jgi:hypothetical protein
MSKAAGISKILNDSHFPRSKAIRTRVRGWQQFTTGFVAENHGDLVIVGYAFGIGSTNEVTEEQRVAVLVEILNALTSRGYEAELRSHSVVVRGKLVSA